MDKADSHRPHGAYNLSWKQVLPFEAVLRSADYWLLAFSSSLILPSFSSTVGSHQTHVQ